MGHETLVHSMRTLISLLVMSLFVIGAPVLSSASTGTHAVHARAKKKSRPKPQKAKKAEKVDKKTKKNDPGFAL